MTTLIQLLSGFISSLAANLVSAFSGGGNSLILLPLLLLTTTGTYAGSLTIAKISATIMTMVSGKMHWKRNLIDRKLLVVLTLAGVIGTTIGTYFLQYHFNEALFKKLLAIILLLTALYLVFSKKQNQVKSSRRMMTTKALIICACFTLIIDILNGIFGGTGIFLTIFLVTYLEMNFVEAIAYTMLSCLIINIIQVSYLIFTEPVSIALTIGVMIGAFAGSWLGTHLLYLKGKRWVKLACILMMVLIGLKMLFS